LFHSVSFFNLSANVSKGTSRYTILNFGLSTKTFSGIVTAPPQSDNTLKDHPCVDHTISFIA
jgi:hypothetical protein